MAYMDRSGAVLHHFLVEFCEFVALDPAVAVAVAGLDEVLHLFWSD
jgi:hypothetical protein